MPTSTNHFRGAQMHGEGRGKFHLDHAPRSLRKSTRIDQCIGHGIVPRVTEYKAGVFRNGVLVTVPYSLGNNKYHLFRVLGFLNLRPKRSTLNSEP